MNTRIFFFSLMGIAASMFGGNIDAVRADLPENRTIVYSIRETPGDPESPVIFTITLRIVPDHVNGNAVSWLVDSATFNRVGTDPKEWTANSPLLPKEMEGYWTIEHDDPLHPQAGEFAAPPKLVGTAVAMDTTYADLDYDFDVVGTQIVGGVRLALARYRFQQAPLPDPELQSESEEPVDVDDNQEG